MSSFTLSVLLLVVFTEGFPGENIRQVTDDDISDVDPREALQDVATHFKRFIARFGKVYETKEVYAHRLKVFEGNLMQAVMHQALDPSAVHGITQFSDLTDEEFVPGLTGVPSDGIYDQAPILPTDGLPDHFDWRAHGAVTEVKNQDAYHDFCGSCWAFSTTGVVEGAMFLKTGKLISLSEQQLIDCNLKNHGCGGGYPKFALKYIMETGLEQEKDYPYVGNGNRTYIDYYHEKCNYQSQKVAATIQNFTICSRDEHQIAANLVKHGPTSVLFNTRYLQSYRSGVSCPLICPKDDLNHAVLLVGYGINGYGLEKMPYWIVKNSCGTEFGEQGYFRMCRNRGMCGINTEAVYAAA